jgi:magnesium transporter
VGDGRHRWVDLLDPDEQEVREHAPADLHPRAFEALTRPLVSDALPRPAIEGHGDYVLGILLLPHIVPAEDRVFVQEVDFVLTAERLLTVRKTPPAGEPYDPRAIEELARMREHVAPGTLAFQLVDDVAEHFLDLLDALDDEIEEAESTIGHERAPVVQRRLVDLREHVIRIRRTLGPTRDAVRGVVDGRTDIEGHRLFRREVFPREVELHFAHAHDKLLRASEGLDFARDMIASLRDFHQALLANEANAVTKALTVIASLLLFPTFIVGVYGQNFDRLPELHWRLGYAFSWAVIVAATIAQLVFFRRRRWI